MSLYNVQTIADTDTDNVVVGGTVGQLYTLPVRVRGVFSLKTYTGGEIIPPYVNKGGTPAVDNWDVFSLVVTDPAATFYLNAGASGNPAYNVAVDYMLDVPVKGGATLTLNQDNKDHVQYRGDADGNLITVPGFSAVDGCWIQLDFTQIFAQLSVNWGGGTKDLSWNAAQLMVSGGRGER